MLRLNVLKSPIDQTWDIYRIATQAPPSTWEAVFEDAKNELIDISRKLDEYERDQGPFYPNKEDIFAAFNYTPLSKVKVVILGQDPYHQTVHLYGKPMPRAMGLSFSVRLGDEVPSSLKNIYTELETTVRGFRRPDHGDLRDWARQGILMLNSCLTVQPSKAGSHGELWMGFITKVFKAISIANPQCIYVLWGRQAQSMRSMIGEKSIVYEAAHPSGLSAKKGFFECDHFNKINKTLIQQGKVSISWHLKSTVTMQNPTTEQTTATVPQRNLVPVNMTMSYPAIPTVLERPPPKQQYPTILGIPTILGGASPLLPDIPNTKKVAPDTIVELKNGMIMATNPNSPTFHNKIKAPSPVRSPQIPIIPNISFNKTPLPDIKPMI
jgi:uracil-DNA glycosylase